MELQPDSPLPLHLQLKTYMASQIAQGILKPGQQLPSERQLCEQFHISRTTVRRALAELEREHLVMTIPARGTFVSSPRVRLSVQVSLSGFSEDVRRAGFIPSSVLLHAGILDTPPPAPVQTALRIAPDEEVVEIERLRLVNDTPLAVHRAYLPHRLCPGILAYSLGEHSLFHLLRERYGLSIAYAEERVFASLATEREAKLLQLPRPAAVLRGERTNFLISGEAVEFSVSAYCGEWYQLNMVLEGEER